MGIVNDLVYSYLQENRLPMILAIDIPDLVASQFDLDSQNAIFAAEIDPRFRMEGDFVIVDLHDINVENFENIEKDIPVEIKEEVARSSLLICKYLDRNLKVTTKQIATDILGVRPFESRFPTYCFAINELLGTIEGYQSEQDGIWRCTKVEGSLELEELQPWKYSVYRSAPTVPGEIMEPTIQDASEPAYLQTRKLKPAIPFTENRTLERFVTRYLSYYERVKGYLTVPVTWHEHLSGENGKITAICNGFEYTWSWKRNGSKRYFYGDGVMDFYYDHSLETGHELKMLLNSDLQ